jgi:hypothetical protein
MAVSCESQYAIRLAKDRLSRIQFRNVPEKRLVSRSARTNAMRSRAAEPWHNGARPKSTSMLNLFGEPLDGSSRV